ncbi:unnamed protein product [Didymodactylos carnosus]|uniref:Sema domain-containing protein n=1 Tax=Didymodactylos carnosus TaxID=1234261 RepID=A0A814LP26_9BILA|nr:unnamed protein product [Didymodactylos carnosus]CAF3835852.1 unnamed protein product [Didymodactylos carnosus]
MSVNEYSFVQVFICITVVYTKLYKYEYYSFDYDIHHLLLYENKLYVGNSLSLSSISLSKSRDVLTINRSNVKNTIKLFLIDNERSELIVCYSDTFGTCEQRSTNDLKLLNSKSLSVVPDDNVNTTIAVFGKIQENISVLYVARTFTPSSSSVPAIAVRYLEREKFMEIIRNNDNQQTSGEASIHFLYHYTQTFIVNYIKGLTNTDGTYIYFLTVQKNDVNDNYITSKISRFCSLSTNINILSNYIEIPLLCQNDDVSYNILIDATIIDVTFSNYTGHERLILGLFGKLNSYGTHVENNLAICLFKLSEIDTVFNQNLKDCYENDTLNRGLKFLKPDEPCGNQKLEMYDSTSNFCIVDDRYSFPIGGRRGAEGIVLYENTNTNAIGTGIKSFLLTDGNIGLAVGWTNGSLTMARINKNMTFNIFSHEVISMNSIGRDIEYEENSKSLIVSSRNKYIFQVYRVPITVREHPTKITSVFPAEMPLGRTATLEITVKNLNSESLAILMNDKPCDVLTVNGSVVPCKTTTTRRVVSHPKIYSIQPTSISAATKHLRLNISGSRLNAAEFRQHELVMILPEPIITIIEPLHSFISGGHLISIQGYYLTVMKSFSINFIIDNSINMTVLVEEIACKARDQITTTSVHSLQCFQFRTPPLEADDILINYTIPIQIYLDTILYPTRFKLIYVPNPVIKSMYPSILNVKGDFEYFLNIETHLKLSPNDIILSIDCHYLIPASVNQSLDNKILTVSYHLTRTLLRSLYRCKVNNRNKFLIKIKIDSFENTLGYLRYETKRRFNWLHLLFITLSSFVFVMIIIIVICVIRYPRRRSTAQPSNFQVYPKPRARIQQSSSCFKLKPSKKKLKFHISIRNSSSVSKAWTQSIKKQNSVYSVSNQVLSTRYRNQDEVIKFFLSNKNKFDLDKNLLTMFDVQSAMQLFLKLLVNRTFLMAFFSSIDQNYATLASPIIYLLSATNSFEQVEHRYIIHFYRLSRKKRNDHQKLFANELIVKYLLYHILQLNLDIDHRTNNDILELVYCFVFQFRICLLKGPRDRLLKKAYYSITPETSLYEMKIDYKRILLNLEYENNIKFKIFALDCDSISQIREKIYISLKYNYDVFKHILLDDIILNISTKDDDREIIRLDDFYNGYRSSNHQQYSIKPMLLSSYKSEYSLDGDSFCSTLDPTTAQYTFTIDEPSTCQDEPSTYNRQLRIQMLRDVVRLLSTNSTKLLFHVIINSRSFDLINIDDKCRNSKSNSLKKKCSQTSTDGSEIPTTIDCRLTLRNNARQSIPKLTTDDSSYTKENWHHLLTKQNYSPKNIDADQQILLLNCLQSSKVKTHGIWTDFLKKLLLQNRTNNELNNSLDRMFKELSRHHQKSESEEQIKTYLFKCFIRAIANCLRNYERIFDIEYDEIVSSCLCMFADGLEYIADVKSISEYDPICITLFSADRILIKSLISTFLDSHFGLEQDDKISLAEDTQQLMHKRSMMDEVTTTIALFQVFNAYELNAEEVSAQVFI